jgi:hypothetical protein
MTFSEPATALTGAPVGHICDACNTEIDSGDLVQGYARRDPIDGWMVRSLWCTACGHSQLAEPTPEADEALVEAVLLKHRLTSIGVTDLSVRMDGSDS